MARRKPGRRDVTDAKRQMTPPPLGGEGERARPLEGQTPEMVRKYDPGFKAPDEDDDPWLDEGRPESSG